MKGKQNAYSLQQNKKFVLDKGYSLERGVKNMGKADKSMKAFLEIPEIFSQLFNVAVFGGKEEIKPEDLSLL